ncbi:MAG: DUF2161 domain-containing phosphodiesterase [Methyloligellaceae bacterium]
MKETELYPPLKSYLEKQGYEVKGEVTDCDIVALRGDEDPVIIELKTTFNLSLIFQSIDRQAISDSVYIAFPAASPDKKNSAWTRNRKDILKLCRRLGLGVITVKFYKRRNPFIEVYLDPAPYKPRKLKRRKSMLLQEFSRRVADHNIGGSTRRPIVTAYRQEALLCAYALKSEGPTNLADLRTLTGLENIAHILQRDVYGWFQRVERATYKISPKGADAIMLYEDVINDLIRADKGTLTPS